MADMNAQSFFDLDSVVSTLKDEITAQFSEAMLDAKDEGDDAIHIQLLCVVSAEGSMHRNMRECAQELEIDLSDDEDEDLSDEVEEKLSAICSELTQQVNANGVSFYCSYNEYWGGLYLCASILLPVGYITEDGNGETFCAECTEEYLDEESIADSSPIFSHEVEAQQRQDPSVIYVCSQCGSAITPLA